MIEIAKKSAREFVPAMRTANLTARRIGKRTTEDASRIGKDTEAAMNYAIDEREWFALAENIGRLANS
ncbi:hypothetical protein ND436_002895 [Neisseria gonorrhoeae]|nr:hypothetical protein ND436_002895 [Neisseria gonorrhoeae]